MEVNFLCSQSYNKKNYKVATMNNQEIAIPIEEKLKSKLSHFYSISIRLCSYK